MLQAVAGLTVVDYKVMPQPSVIAHINTQALLDNFHFLKHTHPHHKTTIAMIKANAYGHGLIPIGKLLEQEANYLGVASIAEGIELRAAGIQTKILIFSGFFDQSHVEPLITHNLIPIIHSDYQIDLLSSYLIAENMKKEIWLKINTGMNRLGFSSNDFETTYDHLKQQYPEASFNVLTHLAEAESTDKDFTKSQIEKFKKCLINKDFDHISTSNSASTLNHNFGMENTIRLGISMYGISTINKPHYPATLQPVMTLKTQIIALHELNKGDSIGYNREFIADKKMTLAIIPIGYGDGYPQHSPSGTSVLVKNIICPIVGKVSMDMIGTDVSKISQINILDSVIMWGFGLPVENVAKEINISPYALIAGLTQRIKRQYG
ncbi:alanine racemase [Francisellaceae bacterium]|nr:alanine racemase [Francisellaceae bacterium]